MLTSACNTAIAIYQDKGMTIKIPGTGCPTCKKPEKNAKEAVRISGFDVPVRKIGNPEEIMNYGVMIIPALMVNEEVKSSGKLLSVEEILNFLK